MKTEIIIVLGVQVSLILYLIHCFFLTGSARAIRELAKLNKISEVIPEAIQKKDVRVLSRKHNELRAFRDRARFHADKAQYFMTVVELSMKSFIPRRHRRINNRQSKK